MDINSSRHIKKGTELYIARRFTGIRKERNKNERNVRGERAIGKKWA